MEKPSNPSAFLSVICSDVRDSQTFVNTVDTAVSRLFDAVVWAVEIFARQMSNYLRNGDC